MLHRHQDEGGKLSEWGADSAGGFAAAAAGTSWPSGGSSPEWLSLLSRADDPVAEVTKTYFLHHSSPGQIS